MGSEFYETNFNDPIVKLVYIWFEIASAKQKTNIQRSSNRTKLFDGYQRKITI